MMFRGVKISFVAFFGIPEGKGLKLHTFRHVQTFYIFVYYAIGLNFNFDWAVAIEAVLTRAVIAAFNSSCKASTILLIAFCLLTSAEQLRIRHTWSHHLLRLVLNALRTAEILLALFVFGQAARTTVLVTISVASANMINFLFCLVRKSIAHRLYCRLENCFKRIENLLFPLWLFELRSLDLLHWLLGQHLLVDVWLFRPLQTHNPNSVEKYSIILWGLLREGTLSSQLPLSKERMLDRWDILDSAEILLFHIKGCSGSMSSTLIYYTMNLIVVGL